MINSVRPVLSTRLNAPGDMDENMVSKMSKLSSMPVAGVSRQVLNSGSFISKRLVEPGLNSDDGAVEAEDGILLLLKPLDKGDGFC